MSIASAPRVVTIADRISIFDWVIAAPILKRSPGLSWLRTSMTVASVAASVKISTSGSGTGIVGIDAYAFALAISFSSTSAESFNASAISWRKPASVIVGACGSGVTIQSMTADVPRVLVRADLTSKREILNTPATSESKPGLSGEITSTAYPLECSSSLTLSSPFAANAICSSLIIGC